MARTLLSTLHRSIRRYAVLGLVLALTAVVIPEATVREAPMSLIKLESAHGMDHKRNMVWVLFLGSDARPGQRVTRTRADAIQMVGVNLEDGKAAMIGVPRDSWVDIPGHGRNKINSAMFYGGPQTMGRAVGNLVGLQPDYVFTAGFDGFRRLVNSIGGVTVNSDFAFSDPVRPQCYKRGPNKLNGFQALIFARIRKAFPRGDFDRSANQQDVIRGIARQVKERKDRPGFMERALLSAVRNLNTNTKPSELYRLAYAATRVQLRDIEGCVVTGSIGSVGGASVVFPNVSQARRLANDARNDGDLDRGCG